MALLLKTQRNTLTRLILEAGYTANDFEWDPEEEGQLLYVGPGRDESYGGAFYFRWSPNQEECAWAPGGTSPWSHEDGIFAFDHILPRFQQWLSYLRREAEAPDLWKEARELGAAIVQVEAPRQADPSTDDVPLVGEERERLLEAVSTVRRQLAAADVEEGQKVEMGKVLDRVEEAGGAVNRKWLIQSILGAVVVVVIEGALTKDNGLWLLARLTDAFNAVHLFGEAAVRGALGS